MSDPTKGSAQGIGSAGENGNTTPNPASGNENQKTNDGNSKVVPLDVHKKTLDELHSLRSTSKELEERLSKFETEKLTNEQNFKGLYERTKADLDKERERNQNLNKWAVNTQRFNEVKSLALTQGLLPNAVNDLARLEDINEEVVVQVTDRGHFVVTGADSYVDRLKAEKPHWFKAAGAPKVNSGGGGAPPKAPKALSPQDVIQAERDYKKGKIAKADYEDVYRKFVQSRNQK
jgi:hypothetical protein